MRTMLSGMILLLQASAFASDLSAPHRKQVELSIGRVVLVSEQGWQRTFGPNSEMVMRALDAERTKIKKLPEAARVEFYWAIMMNIHLDGGYLSEFVQDIAADCKVVFTEELESFLANSKEKGISEERQKVAGKVLGMLALNHPGTGKSRRIK